MTNFKFLYYIELNLEYSEETKEIIPEIQDNLENHKNETILNWLQPHH